MHNIVLKTNMPCKRKRKYCTIFGSRGDLIEFSQVFWDFNSTILLNVRSCLSVDTV